MKGFILAGTNSGCGKTTVAMGLMALFARRGASVAAFKTGPDFIDPMFHEAVTGNPSYNLDSFMLDETILRYLFAKHAAGRDISIVEGAMGLFDGLGAEGRGSAAEVAAKLHLPVVLVADAKAMSQSVVAVVLGYRSFRTDIAVRGVILNRVPDEEHYLFLKDLVERHTGVPCLGYLPRDRDLAVESRHLGLVQAEEVGGLGEKIRILAELFSRTIDARRLEVLASECPEPAAPPDAASAFRRDLSGLHLAVASDKAFRFYYRDNIELLEENGARLSYFSPLADAHLPEGATALYFGGGYPEIFARELQENSPLREEIRARAEGGLPVFAECGGLMYLTRGLVRDGEEFPMVGLFNCRARMTDRLQRFGYAILRYGEASAPCHEFHNSVLELGQEAQNYELRYSLTKPGKDRGWSCGLRRKNCLAGYAHVHFYSSPSFFRSLIDLWMTREGPGSL